MKTQMHTLHLVRNVALACTVRHLHESDGMKPSSGHVVLLFDGRYVAYAVQGSRLFLVIRGCGAVLDVLWLHGCRRVYVADQDGCADGCSCTRKMRRFIAARAKIYVEKTQAYTAFPAVIGGSASSLLLVLLSLSCLAYRY
jgi:hypothetical protein